MRVSSILFATVVLILLISLLSIWFYPSIQDFRASNTTWNGINEFSNKFSANQIDSLDDLPDLTKKAILVAIPYLDYTKEELSKIKKFVDSGGTLLLMDDYGYGNSVLAYLGVNARFTNESLLDPLFNYKNWSIPQIRDFDPMVRESDIGDIDVIMLNHATTLANISELEAIAWSSSASFLDMNKNERWDEGEPKGPFAIATEFQLGMGTVALITDPSIIINTMVGKNDNYDFVRYLTRHGGAEKIILVDRSHLTKTPLDMSKTRLINTRKVLSSPFALVVITAMIFIVVSRYTLKKGETIG